MQRTVKRYFVGSFQNPQSVKFNLVHSRTRACRPVLPGLFTYFLDSYTAFKPPNLIVLDSSCRLIVYHALPFRSSVSWLGVQASCRGRGLRRSRNCSLWCRRQCASRCSLVLFARYQMQHAGALDGHGDIPCPWSDHQWRRCWQLLRPEHHGLVHGRRSKLWFGFCRHGGTSISQSRASSSFWI